MTLERVDKVLVDKGYADSRTQAQKLIEAGAVKGEIHGQWISLNKAAQKISPDTCLVVQAIDELRYVSRAGLKLELALKHIGAQNFIQPQNIQAQSPKTLFAGCFILDIGQSTGGFTDCALQHQAERVVGVDVGHAQLAGKLRGHNQIVCLEGVNARDLPVTELMSYAPEGYDWILMDVSFISQTLIHARIPQLLRSGGYLLSLVKPQFEVGPENLAKGGIVKDTALFEMVKQKVTDSTNATGLTFIAYFSSGLPGADGNNEFFLLCQKP